MGLLDELLRATRELHDVTLHRRVIRDPTRGLEQLGEDLGHVPREVNGAGLRALLDEPLLEIDLHLLGGLVAVLGLGGQRLHDDALELCGEATAHRRRGRDLGLGDHADRVVIILPTEQARADRDLVEHDPQGEDVRALVELAAIPDDLLGAHVRELPLELAGLGVGEALLGLRDPEVTDLHAPVHRDQDVLRRDIPVHDVERLPGAVPASVRVVQARGGLGDDLDRQRERDEVVDLEATLAQRPQVLPVHELHGDVEEVLDLTEVIDLDDARVVELRGDARLVEEHRDELWIFCQVLVDALDRHLLGEPADLTLALGEEHLGHASLGDLAN